jgi:hypothetical protein
MRLFLSLTVRVNRLGYGTAIFFDGTHRSTDFDTGPEDGLDIDSSTAPGGRWQHYVKFHI